jgi:tRNA threonylcarbamoyladenosine biosynthesis protein TsaE
MKLIFQSIEQTKQFSALMGSFLVGGEVLELRGDVGSGKTTFTKGLAEGLGIDDEVQSPSFTISRFYTGRDGLELHHYDFYRLPDPGIMRYDIAESTADARAITVVEWAETVAGVLPENRTVLTFAYGDDEHDRTMTVEHPTKGMEEAYATWTKNR